MTTMSENQYLSIGEVLGLLLEDFPDVTISKIRFLESQGLIEPERTPSGYRKFYDHDVDLLRAILHEQKENFLPLKVIRDRIESGTIETDPTGGRTPPRGIRNVEIRDTTVPEVPQRDSVFRRTDGGPEWADGKALIPGDIAAQTSRHPSARPATGSVPVTPLAPIVSAVPTPAASSRTADDPAASSAEAHVSTPPLLTVVGAHEPAEPSRPSPKAATKPAPPAAPAKPASTVASAQPAAPAKAAAADLPGLPYSRDELRVAAEITEEQLRELDEFGVVPSRGSGADATYQADAVEIARIAARFLEQGIDARHLRSWRQAAERESALFEQRIMPLLRQRNPQSRQQALQTLSELAELGNQLRAAMIESMLRHHFDGA